MVSRSSYAPIKHTPCFVRPSSLTKNTVIFTVANLLITETFPEDTQALAGAVFNTVAQFGSSLGIVIMAVISASATAASSFEDKNSPEALLVGYRAVFWACLAFSLLATFAGMVGLRKAGKVGIKKDQ